MKKIYLFILCIIEFSSVCHGANTILNPYMGDGNLNQKGDFVRYNINNTNKVYITIKSYKVLFDEGEIVLYNNKVEFKRINIDTIYIGKDNVDTKLKIISEMEFDSLEVINTGEGKGSGFNSQAFKVVKASVPTQVQCEEKSFSTNYSIWDYHFDCYTSIGGILETNMAIPLYMPNQAILDTMLSALPENRRTDINHPEYFPSPEPEIVVKEDAEVFVTFHHEGAGYKNTLGFYTYEGDTNRSLPESIQDIKNNGKILFANASLINKGGDLKRNTSISLGEFSAGTKVIFFLISNGWKGKNVGVKSNSWIFTSWSQLNPNYDEFSTLDVPEHKQVALLWKDVGLGKILLMGFEDILRKNNNCDHDFNDALFSVSSSPMSALIDTIEVDTGLSGFSVAIEDYDSDEDGVNDAFDAFPADASRTYVSYYPSKTNKTTLIFEDMWPVKGDYDMNDLAIDFSIKEIKDNKQQVKDIIFSGSIQSYGADNINGFALLLDTPISNISTVEMSQNYGPRYDIIDNIHSDGNSTMVKLFDDAEVYLERYTNVYKDDVFKQSDTFELFITLKNSTLLSSPPYNPFIIVSRYLPDKNGSYVFMDNIEVHLPNNEPSSLAPLELFSTLDDNSNKSIGRTYLTSDNKPWALLVPSMFAHPAEGFNIEEAYHNYHKWVKSGGDNYKDWYIHDKKDNFNKPYSDESKIIIRKKVIIF